VTERQLTYQDLNIQISDIFKEMGYHDGAHPEDSVVTETEAITADVSTWLRPRFAFLVKYGLLNIQSHCLTIDHCDFKIDRIIAKQLKQSEAFSCFVATAGKEYEAYQQKLSHEGDMVKSFIANALGSIIAEKCADEMELFLQESIEKLGWKHTNRFSPGYCGWHVSEQQQLFSLFNEKSPCGIHLTDSSLMIPIKSVSGIIGVGKDVRKNEYSCGLCDFDKCYKRQHK